LGGAQIGNFLWRYFGDVSRWRNSDDVTEMASYPYFEVRFRIISFKNHLLFGQITDLQVTNIED